MLRTLDGSVVTFAVSPATPVRLNGARATIADIHPGFVARVAYDRQVAGRARSRPSEQTAAATTTDRGVVTAVTTVVDHPPHRERRAP